MSEVTGIISLHPRGFGFLEYPLESRSGAGEARTGSAFVAPPELNPFVAGDRVRATVTVGQGGKTQATRLELVARTRRELFGAVVMRDGKKWLRPDKLLANTDSLLGGAESLAEGTFVVATLTAGGPVVARVVPPTEVGLDRILVRWGVRGEFPPACQALGGAAPSFSGRRDLRDLPTVTIDAPVSKDLDDALAVLPAAPDGGMRVLVSVADVDSMVPEGSPIDREARARGTSAYLAGRVVPMLPAALSEDALSLLPGVDRPALTVELRVDADGEVTSTDLYTSVIRSHARLSYEAVAAFLERGEDDAVPLPLHATLRWLRTAAARISATRTARGGVQLLREEAYVTLDAATREPTRVDVRESTSAHLLVERLMVSANEAVARWLVARGLPGVFRVHDAPDAAAVAALAESATNFGFETGFGGRLSPRGLAAFEAQYRVSHVAPALTNVLGRALGPARYTVHPTPHFGLAAPMYLHFTSPIRRYADLAVHRIVKGFLAGERDRLAGEAALEELSQHLNDAAYRSMKAEMERLHALAARLFATRIGERFAGNVVAVKPFGLVVQLVGTGVTGTIATEALEGLTFGIGSPIEVVVTGANEELGRIDLAPIAPPTPS